MPNKPEDIINTVPKESNLNKIKNYTDSLINSKPENREPLNAAKPQGGANYGTSGLNFERYYGKSAYSKLGFNPYIDNEKNYNENSTFMDDIIDVNVNGMKLAGLGFNSMWSGKSNRQEAEEYEKYSNIGSSSKGGIGGTITNAYLNFGYTAGLLTEIAAEEVGLMGLEAITGGGATPFVGARTAANVGRLGKAFMTTAEMSGKVTSVLERVKDLKNVATAKSFYEGAKSFGKAVNPLRGTTEYLATAGRQYTRNKAGQVEKLSSLANATRGFGTFYRDIRELNLAFDEAQLESGFVSNGTKDDLVSEYTKTHGKYPDSVEMEKINKEAKRAADNTLATNSLLIYTTNRIAFGNVFNKYMPKVIRETSKNLAGGRVVKNFKTNKLDYIKHGEGFLGYKTLVNEAKYAAANFKRTPLETVKFLGKYSRANFGEGAQEYFQEVIQDAESKMARDRYLGTVAGGAWYNALTSDAYMKSYGESLDKYISAEGAEIFAGGFVMGAFAGPFSNVTQRAQKTLSSSGQYIFDKAGYNQSKEQEEKYKTETEANIAKFNDLTDTRKDFIHDYVSHLTKQAQYKAEMDKASDKNSQKEFQDAKEKSIVEAILFAEKMGGQDLILQQIKDMSQLSEEDARDAFGADSETKLDGLKDFKSSYTDVVKRAEEIIEFSKEFDEMFPPPDYNVENELDDYEFTLETQLTHAYMMAAREKIKKETILNQHALVRSMERMDSILKNFPKQGLFFNKDKTPPSNEVTKIFNSEDLYLEVGLLNEEIKALEGFSPKTAQQSKDLAYKKKSFAILSTLVGEDGIISKFQENAASAKPKKTPVNNLRKAYKKYMQLVGTEFNNPVNDAKIDSTFEDFKDFYILSKDKENLTKTVNFLLNPEVHTDMINRMMAVTKKEKENLKETVEEQLKIFEKSKQLAELIQMIAKNYNLVIPEDELQLLDDENIIPDTYQNMDTGLALRPGTQSYENVRQAINNWLYSSGRLKEEETKETTEEAPVEEAKVTSNEKATIDSPFKEWPEELQKKANMLMGAHNRTIEGTGAEYYEDVEEFVTEGNPGYEKMKPFFLAPAAKVKPQATSTDINVPEEPTDAIAEIERKRQELVEEGLQELNEGNRTEEQIENSPNSWFKNIWGYIRGKHGSDVDSMAEGMIGSDDTATLDKIKSAIKISKFGLGFSKFMNSLEKEINKANDRLNERVNKGIRENYPQSSIDKLTKERDEKVAENNRILQEAKKINAKYDAELAALEGTKPQTPDIQTDAAIEISLPKALENELFNGDIQLLVISRIADDVEQAISKELRKQKLIPNNGTIEDLKPGTKITIVKKTADNKNTYIELTFKGKVNKVEAGVTDLEDATKKLNLTENIITGYKENPIIKDGEILQLHARNINEKFWVENERNKLYVFEVSDPTNKKIATSKESIDAWRNSVINKFDISQDLKATLDQIQEEDTMRSIEGKESLGAEIIFALYEKAEEKFRGELTPEKLELNTEYKVNIPFKVNGKNRNFGSAIVIEKTPLGVTFRSTGKTTKGETKFINAETLPKVIIKKLSTDINAEKFMGESKVTPEEEEIINTSTENSKPLSDAKIQEMNALAETMSPAERIAYFKNNKTKC